MLELGISVFLGGLVMALFAIVELVRMYESHDEKVRRLTEQAFRDEGEA